MADQPKVPMRTLRTAVPPEVFDVLQQRANDRGINLAAYVRSVLVDAVEAGEPLSPGAAAQQRRNEHEKAQWPAFLAWLTSRDLTIDRVMRDTGIKRRSDLLKWGRERGFGR